MKNGRLEQTDLMVGDWVDIRSDAAPNIPHIERITHAHLLRGEIWLPIPITDEIMEKIGLRKGYAAEYYDQDTYSDEFDTFGLTKGLDGSYVFETFTDWCERHSDGSPKDYGISSTNVITGIQYLHELQHAMRLCRIDKKIEL